MHPEKYKNGGTSVVLDVAGVLLSRNQPGLAAPLLDSITTVFSSPQHLFLTGEMLLKAGDRVRGRAILESLMVKFPRDVFSGRARMILTKMR